MKKHKIDDEVGNDQFLFYNIFVHKLNIFVILNT